MMDEAPTVMFSDGPNAANQRKTVCWIQCTKLFDEGIANTFHLAPSPASTFARRFSWAISLSRMNGLSASSSSSEYTDRLAVASSMVVAVLFMFKAPSLDWIRILTQPDVVLRIFDDLRSSVRTGFVCQNAEASFALLRATCTC